MAPSVDRPNSDEASKALPISRETENSNPSPLAVSQSSPSHPTCCSPAARRPGPSSSPVPSSSERRRSEGAQGSGTGSSNSPPSSGVSISAEARPGISVQSRPTPMVEERSSPESTEGTRARRAVPPRATERRAWGGAVGPRGRSAGHGSQVRFLKRQLSLPVSRMSQWCVRRSSSAVVILASAKTRGHSAKARLVDRTIEVRS